MIHAFVFKFMYLLQKIIPPQTPLIPKIHGRLRKNIIFDDNAANISHFFDERSIS